MSEIYRVRRDDYCIWNDSNPNACIFDLHVIPVDAWDEYFADINNEHQLIDNKHLLIDYHTAMDVLEHMEENADPLARCFIEARIGNMWVALFDVYRMRVDELTTL